MDIHDLLEKKAFEELNRIEQTFVLEQMTSEEYDYEHNIILKSQAFFELEATQIKPEINVSNKTLLALRAKSKEAESNKKTSWIVALLAYKIPAWQAIAAMLLVFFFVRGLGVVQQSQMIVVADESLRDTVFVKEYITQLKELPTDTVIKVVYKNYDRKENKSKRILATNKAIIDVKPKVNLKPKVVVQEFDNVLQYCNSSSSIPASKDTFLHLLSNEVFF